MKTLASCTPTEFISQTVKIRNSVEKWLTSTKILEIRKRLPAQLPVTKDMDTERAKENLRENIRARQEQALKNLWAMFDSCFVDHPEETLEVLALVCFVEPEEVDSYPMSTYIEAVSEMLGNESVVSFFTSLMKLGQVATLKR